MLWWDQGKMGIFLFDLIYLVFYTGKWHLFALHLLKIYGSHNVNNVTMTSFYFSNALTHKQRAHLLLPLFFYLFSNFNLISSVFICVINVTEGDFTFSLSLVSCFFFVPFSYWICIYLSFSHFHMYQTLSLTMLLF